VREIDEAGVRSLTQAAALYVARWRRYARGLARKKRRLLHAAIGVMWTV
jgi:hypothetical protein